VKTMKIHLLLILAISACTPFKLYDSREDAESDAARDERAENSSDSGSGDDAVDVAESSSDAVDVVTAADVPASTDVVDVVDVSLPPDVVQDVVVDVRPDVSIVDTAPDTASDVPADVRPDAPGTCTDGIQNGLESDIDCGGGVCRQCRQGNHCRGVTDCLSFSAECRAGSCFEPACIDGRQTGLETDIDCGAYCAACVVGRRCQLPSDCASSRCSIGDAGFLICMP